MKPRIDPSLLYGDAPFFLDAVAGKTQRFFSFPMAAIAEAAQRRTIPPPTRTSVCKALTLYNRSIDAPPSVLEGIEALGDSEALCILGGQQAGFLGGPQLVAYKIASILSLAKHASDMLQRPVLPIFWLASEDHDLQEINRVRVLDAGGKLRTVSFDWSGEGRPVEQMPITREIAQALRQALRLFPAAEDTSSLFEPKADDDYCHWHARIWSRVFGPHGLILVEPRVLRPFADEFFTQAHRLRSDIHEALRTRADALSSAGYPVLLDPETAGTLFTFDADGRRIRTGDDVRPSHADSTGFSPDAALRPLLADALLPTLAHIVGPSELTYQAMLQPLYDRFGIAQPLVRPRFGATLLRQQDQELLEAFGLSIEDLIVNDVSIAEIAGSKASPQLRNLFKDVRTRIEALMQPLAEPLTSIEPGLATRLRQTTDQLNHQLDRLEERAIRADLGRNGLSVREAQRIAELVSPGHQLQERGLSFFHFVSVYGVQWVDELIALAPNDVFTHYQLSV